MLLWTSRHLAESQDNVGYVDETWQAIRVAVPVEVPNPKLLKPLTKDDDKDDDDDDRIHCTRDWICTDRLRGVTSGVERPTAGESMEGRGEGCTAWKRGSCRTVEERRSTTSLRISTNSNERVLDSGMPSSPDVIPWSMKVKEEDERKRRTRERKTEETLRWKAKVAAGKRGGKRKASFDGPRVPRFPRDLTLTESQK